MPEKPRLTLEQYRQEKAEMAERYSEPNIRKLFDGVDEYMKGVPREQPVSDEYLRFRHGPLVPNPRFKPNLT